MAIPKYIARDSELLSAGIDPQGRPMPQWQVVQSLLSCAGTAFAPYGGVPWSVATWPGNGSSSGYYSSGYGASGSSYSNDCLRHWMPNGQCYYSDMSHWEGCTAEVLAPRDFAAQSLSSLYVAEEARRLAEQNADPGTRFILSALNVDSQDPGVSWGTHVNFTVSDDLWFDLFRRHSHPARLGFVASALAAAVAWFGGGYLLPLKDGTKLFSLCGRAHHLGRVISDATTVAFQRGLLNSRNEPHAADVQRLHLIGFDFNLASAAPMASFVQCLLAAAEEGYCGLQLYDPVRAVRSWSWGIDLSTLTLPAEAVLIDGRRMTLPAYVRELSTVFLQMVEGGLIGEDVAPQAKELLPLVIQSTRYAEEGSLAQLARHSDWAAMLMVLLNMCRQPGTQWGDPTSVLAVQEYSNTDRQRGVFWRLWEQGLVDPLVQPADVERCLYDGPEGTRAWARGRLVQKFHRWITAIDWSYVEFRRTDSRWSPRLRVEMPRLDSLARAEFEPVWDASWSVQDLEVLMCEERKPATTESDPVLQITDQLAVDPEPLLAERDRFKD